MKRCNYVDEMVIKTTESGGMITRGAKLKAIFNAYIKKRLTEDHVGGEFRMLGENYRVELKREFNEEEIYDGLRQCNDEKAPDPNGFNMKFLNKRRFLSKEKFS